MSFSIILERNLSENNKVTKTVETIATVTGSLKDGTSIINPVILISGDISDYVDCNYLDIPTFQRKYFVRDITSVRNGLFEVSCHVDVLSSWETEIKTNDAIVKRQEKKFNLYLNDGSFRTYQNPVITTHPFPNGFSGLEFVLAVAGASGIPQQNI